jgi:glycosyltransferase involved in cell wall biosynthesis
VSDGHRIRILLVDHVSKVLGGAEVNVLELLAHPGVRDAWDVTVACAPGSPLARAIDPLQWPRRDHGFAPALNELRVVGRRFSPLAKLRAWQELQQATNRLKQLATELRPDVVLSCTNKDHFAAGAAARALSIPSAWWVNDILSSDFFGWPVRRAFVSRARRLQPRLAAVSHFGQQALIHEGVPANAVRTVHNGIPLARYRRDARRPLRAQLGLADSEPLFGIVGRLTPWKGQDIFLRVAAQWAKSGRPGRFAIIGGAFNEDAPFETHLREFVQHHGLAQRVHFVPFQPDIASAISSLDVLIHASTKPEPFGRVLIEAMALEVPVIAARGGGVPEIVTDGVDGLLVPPGDVAGTTHALERLLNHPNSRSPIIEAASRTVREKFSMERVFTDWHALLSEASGRW